MLKRRRRGQPALSASTLVAGALLEAAAFVCCVLAARAVHQRGDRDDFDATLAYTGFWGGIGVVHALQGALSAWAAVAPVGLMAAVLVWQARMIVLIASFFCLVYYLLVIYTGSRRVLLPLGVFYVAMLVAALAFISWAQPTGTLHDPWRVALFFEKPLAGPPYLALVLALFGPPLAAAIAYARLGRHATSQDQSRRIRLTTVSFALYFVALIVGYVTLALPMWGAMEMALGAIAALGIVAAHRPPRGASLPAFARDSALQQRIQTLV